MVQYKRKPIPSEPVKHFRNDVEVWIMELTGEVFGSYEAYLQKLDYYNQRKFTCEITGHTNLTFFEALKSETHGSAELDSTFPIQLREPILRKVQFSTIGRIDELVNSLYETFREDFFPGEHVQIHLDNFKDPSDRLEGVIRDKASFPEVRFSDGTLERPAISRYFVTVTGELYREALVDNKHIFRDRRSFTKQVLRSFLKNSVFRERWEGAPWLVKETMARTYNIDTAIPARLQHENVLAEKKAHAALKRGRPDEQCLEFFAAQGIIPGLAQATQQYNGKLPKELVIHFQDTLAGKISPFGPRPIVHGAFPHHDKVIKLHPPAPIPPPPVTIKYPIEDLEIFPRKNYDQRPSLKFWDIAPMSNSFDGKSRTDDGMGMKTIGPLLEIWNTLTVHANFFVLSPFNFDDFVDAMFFQQIEVECELLSEIHCTVLKALVDGNGNADPAIPAALDSDDEEEHSSAEDSRLSTPVPETRTRSTTKSQRSSLLRHDISEAIRSNGHSNGVHQTETHLADEMVGEQDWTDLVKKRDFKAGGWQTIIVGLLYQLSLAGKHSVTVDEILSFLAPLNQKPVRETARLQYARMGADLRVAALEIIMMFVIRTKKLKDSMESRMVVMTDDRKEKVSWQRERKALIEELHTLDEQRRELQPEEAKDFAPSGVNDLLSIKSTNEGDVDGTYIASLGSDEDEPSKGRSTRRVSSRANELKRKREEAEVRKEKEKQARLENPEILRYKKLLGEVDKKKKDIRKCEDEINALEEKLRLNACHRTKVLGRDRFWNRYYWFERNGMPFGGEDPNAPNQGYANGRIWVQGPDDLERAGFIELPAEEMSQYSLAFGMSLHKRREVEEGSTRLDSAHEWGCYDSPEAFDKLITWLDERGNRERVLRKELQTWRDKIVEYMGIMSARLKQAADKKTLSEEPIPGIATRKKTHIDNNSIKFPCLTWTNVLAKQELGHLHSDGPTVGKLSTKGKAQNAVTEKSTTHQGTRLR